MKRRLFVIFAILCLILCLGLASCGGNDNPGTENGGNTENSGSVEDSGNTENSGSVEDSGNAESSGSVENSGSVEDNKNYVTITFDTKGGSVLESVQIEKGSKIPKPQDPERLGYTFDKWSVDGTEWVFVGYVATEDMTLEASWTPVKYTIEYVGAYGRKSTYTVEDEFDLVGDCEDYYEFLGWYEDQEYKKPISKIEKGTTGNLKLYGKTEYTGIILELNQDGYAVVHCDKNATSIVIPESYKGLKVTSIGDYAFNDCTSLTSVKIPNSVTTIGNYVFDGCTNIEELEAPTTFLSKIPKDSLQAVVINGGELIDDGAFRDCTGLTSVTIGDSVTTIGDCAFLGCTGLTSVTIGDSVTTIGSGAFLGCTRLTSIEIPNSVTEIGSSTFTGCTGLTSVEIPNSVTTIGDYAFSGCTGLTSVTIPNSVTSIGSYAFKYCTKLTSVEIPNSVTSIGYETFFDCTGLTSIVIPNSVTSIGYGAFENCTGLTSVTIPNSVTTIGSYAFSDCTELTRVDISDIGAWCNISFGNSYANPLYYAENLYLNGELVTDLVISNSVTSIGNSAFYGCTGLTSVVIPNSVTTIDSYAFSGCTGLTSIIVDEGNPRYKSIDGNLYSKDGKALIQYAIGKKDTSFVIPNSVTTIGSSAFYGCTGLTSVKIPNSVTTIGFYAFYGCTGLTNIVIPNSVTGVGYNAFLGCTGLTIYCEAESKPDGWTNSWKPFDRPVVWGHKMQSED